MRASSIDSGRLRRRVEASTGLPPDRAHEALIVVLAELGEALTWGEARNVAELLPRDLGQAMRDAANGQGNNRYSLESFLRLTGERLGSDPEATRVEVRAVLSALRAELPADRFAAIVEELPNHTELLGGDAPGRVQPEEGAPGAAPRS